jgi:WD40 repeat protein
MSEFTVEAFKKLQLEYNSLLASLKEERKKTSALEDECDLLAEHNCRLETELAALKVNQPVSSTPSLSSGVGSLKRPDVDVNSLSLGDESTSIAAGIFVQESAMTISNAAGASNVLSVGILPLPGRSIAVCGGVDKTLRLFDLASGDPLAVYSFAAPVLAVDVFMSPGVDTDYDNSGDGQRLVGLVGCSMMDGSHAVVSVRAAAVRFPATRGAVGATEDSEEDVQLFHDHSKYVVCLRFSPDGRRFATCSYDRSVNLYSLARAGAGQERPRYVRRVSYRFQTTPESLVFVPAGVGAGGDNSGGAKVGEELVVALRDVCYLTYLTNLPQPPTNDAEAAAATATAEVVAMAGEAAQQGDQHHRKVSLNENDWDTHVSFTPLFLSLSPSGALLLVSTSHSMHYCYRTGTNLRVQTLTGHTSNEYSKPRTCWGSESVVYSNTEACGDIFVFFLHSAKILHVIGGCDGHRGIVKDLATHPSVPNTLVSGSFDKTLRVWKPYCPCT